jgi:predicted RNase H-like nuclease
MTTILGIDAAWTASQPSGVALVSSTAGNWRLLFAGSSYRHLLDHDKGDLISNSRPLGSVAEPAALLAAASKIAEAPVDLVAVDMPLALEPIAARRVSDNLVSAAYGARHCSTHTPSAIRPGKISDDLRGGFERCGYCLLTKEVEVPGLLEVYPHPALVELMRAERRLPYKHGKARNYWPGEPPAGRRMKLFEIWRSIIDGLDREIAGTSNLLLLPSPEAPAWQLKAFEDMLDAVICAWIGICVYEGTAVPFGDDTSVIWIPQSGLLSSKRGRP